MFAELGVTDWYNKKLKQRGEKQNPVPRLGNWLYVSAQFQSRQNNCTEELHFAVRLNCE